MVLPLQMTGSFYHAVSKTTTSGRSTVASAYSGFIKQVFGTNQLKLERKIST
jgi:hypothetical protein